MQAIGCPKRLECRCDNCVGAHWDSDFGEQAGIYLLTPNQNLIENHVFGAATYSRRLLLDYPDLFRRTFPFDYENLRDLAQSAF